MTKHETNTFLWSATQHLRYNHRDEPPKSIEAMSTYQACCILECARECVIGIHRQPAKYLHGYIVGLMRKYEPIR